MILLIYIVNHHMAPPPPPILTKSGLFRQILVKKSPVSNFTKIRHMGAALIRGVRRTELIGAFRCSCERSEELRYKDVGKVLRGTVRRQVHVLQPWLVLPPPTIGCSSVDPYWTLCLHTEQRC